MTTSRFSLLLFIVLGLNACGFSLRGSDVLSSQFAAIRIDSQEPNSEFSRLLRRSLEIANVTIETGSGESGSDEATETPTLAISAERLVSRPVSINPRARAAQYEIRLSVIIALGLADEYLIPQETLFIERSYFEDIENISGNREEIEIITAEMRRDLVNQLIRRLQSTAT